MVEWAVINRLAVKWHPLNTLWLLAKRCLNKTGYLLSALGGVIIKKRQDHNMTAAFLLTSAHSSWLRPRVTWGPINYSHYILQVGRNMLEHTETGASCLLLIYSIWKGNYRPHIFLSILFPSNFTMRRTMNFLLLEDDTYHLSNPAEACSPGLPWDVSQMLELPTDDKQRGPMIKLSSLHSAGAQLLSLMSNRAICSWNTLPQP